MTTAVDHDSVSGIALVRPPGELTAEARIPLRATVYKLLAQCPAAIIVDLSGVTHVSPLAHSTLLTLAVEAAHEPVTPFLLYARGNIARELALNGPMLRIYPSILDARRALLNWPLTGGWRSYRLPDVPQAAHQAAALVADACLDWHIPQLLMPARAVARDLTQLARGARDMYLTVALRPDRLLLISVRDYDTAERSAHRPNLREPVNTPNRQRLTRDGACYCGRLVAPSGVTWWATIRYPGARH